MFPTHPMGEDLTRILDGGGLWGGQEGSMCSRSCYSHLVNMRRGQAGESRTKRKSESERERETGWQSSSPWIHLGSEAGLRLDSQRANSSLVRLTLFFWSLVTEWFCRPQTQLPSSCTLQRAGHWPGAMTDVSCEAFFLLPWEPILLMAQLGDTSR